MIRAQTHFRCTRREIQSRFSRLELRGLMLAEHECPWGEMAMNYRTEYLACRFDSSSQGWSQESRKKFSRRADRIAAKLFGPSPEPKPVRAVDLVRDDG